MMILRSWNGFQNSRRNHFRARTYRSCSWYPEWRRKTTPHRKPVKSPPARECSTRKCLSRQRPEASGPVGPHAIGPLAFSSYPQLPLPPPPPRPLPITPPTPLSPSPSLPRRRPRRERGIAATEGRGESACIAQRIRRRSGGLGPWARRRYATRAGWGTSRAGWCQSTGPQRAQHSCWLSTQTRTARCWSSGARRRWWGPSNSSCCSCSSITTRTLCSMSHHPTVMISWSINTWDPISRTSSSTLLTTVGILRWQLRIFCS